MIDLSAIKSEKLRELVGNSVKFEVLSEDEQKNTLDHIVELSAEKQEEFYVPFFKEENKKEEAKMEEIGMNQNRALFLMLEKIKEMDKKISILAREDLEKQDRENDKQKQNELLKQLKSL